MLEIPAWIFQPCVRIASSVVHFVLVWIPLAAAFVGWCWWLDPIIGRVGVALTTGLGVLLALPTAALLALFVRVQTGSLKMPPSN
jgi:hypothetical protein